MSYRKANFTTKFSLQGASYPEIDRILDIFFMKKRTFFNKPIKAFGFLMIIDIYTKFVSNSSLGF
jgi:hypothetical protein